MTRRTLCLEVRLRYLAGGGAMICAMVPEPRTYLVRPLCCAPHYRHGRLILGEIHLAHVPYLGLAIGGVWGLREGGTRKLAVASGRLRLNSILNSVTRRGSFMGNSAGALGMQRSSKRAHHIYQTCFKALIYNAVNSSIDSYRGTHDQYGSMAAGGLTGALFKSSGSSSSM
jgi:hypothetical protein